MPYLPYYRKRRLSSAYGPLSKRRRLYRGSYGRRRTRNAWLLARRRRFKRRNRRSAMYRMRSQKQVLRVIVREEKEVSPDPVTPGLSRHTCFADWGEVKKVVGFKSLSTLFDEVRMGKCYYKFFIKRAGKAITDSDDEVIKLWTCYDSDIICTSESSRPSVTGRITHPLNGSYLNPGKFTPSPFIQDSPLQGRRIFLDVSAILGSILALFLLRSLLTVYRWLSRVHRDTLRSILGSIRSVTSLRKSSTSETCDSDKSTND